MALPDGEEKEFNRILSEMSNIYGSSVVCSEDNECLELEPGLSNLMANSDNYTLRTYVWQVNLILQYTML